MPFYLIYKIFSNIDYGIKIKLQISSIPVPVLAALLGGVAGAITGALAHIWSVRRQSKRELKSLIIVFATESILAFERCVLYYKQAEEEGKISFSSLFDFTDPSILSRFAIVNPEPDLIAAIMDLKSIYFQIRRHVEEASRCAVQSSRLAEGEKEKVKIWEEGKHAQGVALAFFLDRHGKGKRYETTVDKTTLVLDAAKKIKSGKVVKELEKRFEKAKHEKSRLDAPKAKQKKEEKKQNKS